MPSTVKTENYGLNQWQGNEYLKRPDLNDDNLKIDTALHGVSTNINNHLADYVRNPGYAITTGSANAYTATLNPVPVLVDGMGLVVKIHAENTGASTLNLNGLGAKPIIDSKGYQVKAGRLLYGRIYSLKYDGANFQLQGEGGDIPKLPNIAKNGNFANGLNAFAAYNTASISTASNIVTFTGSAQYARIEQYVPIINGHKYYVCGSLKATSSAVAVEFHKNASPWNVLAAALSPGNNTMTFVSAVGTATETANDYAFRIMDNRASGWDAVQGTQLMLIDLTAAYGAGKEPTKAEMDALVQTFGGWWDSTLAILTADGNITAGDVLQDKVGYGNNVKVIGAIPIKNPDLMNQINALGVIAGANSGDGYNYVYLQFTDADKFFQSARWVRSYQPDLLAANISYNKNICGVVGTNQNKQWASGTVAHGALNATAQYTLIDGFTSGFLGVTISGLAFRPRKIILRQYDPPSAYTSYSVYDEVAANADYLKVIRIFMSRGGTQTNGTIWSVKGDVAPAAITANGFTMPLWDVGNNANVTWEAYE